MTVLASISPSLYLLSDDLCSDGGVLEASNIVISKRMLGRMRLVPLW